MASIKDDKGYNQGFKRNFTFHKRIERRAKWMLDEMGEVDENIHILEIGCGTGEISNYIAKKSKAKILGIDICEPFIKIAKSEYKNQNLEYKVEDFLKFKSDSKKYDFIIGNGILHHLYFNIDKSLIIMKTLLKENGKIIFMEPNIKNPYCFLIFKLCRKLANLDPDEMAFSKTFIKKKLEMNSYNDINVYYKDFLIPIIPFFLVNLISRLSNFFEKIYPLNRVSQSIFIIACK